MSNTYQIEGRNPVIESLESDQKPQFIYLESTINKDKKISQIIELAAKYNVQIRYIGKNKLTLMSKTKVHQGVIAVKAEKKDISLEKLLDDLYDRKENPFLIIIREALYEHNLGAIIRTAECAHANGIIITPKTQITPQVIRASMGATEHIPVVKGSFFQVLKTLNFRGVRMCSIEVNAKKYYFEENLKGPLALIIGGEDRSLTQKIQQQTDISVKIPLKGKVNSLNMSVAAAIVIFEKVRQEMI